MLHMPEGVASLDAAAECIQLAEHYGPPRDDAQKITLQAWMGTQADSRWAAAIAAHAMSRQNGKGDEIEDRACGQRRGVHQQLQFQGDVRRIVAVGAPDLGCRQHWLRA